MRSMVARKMFGIKITPRKIKVTILSVIVLFHFAKCNSNDDVEECLVNNCYWDIYIDKIETGKSYSFEEDNVCKYYYYNSDHVRRRYDDDDVIVKDEWKIDADTISIREQYFKIASIGKDTILLTDPYSDKQMQLLKNCN